jgi:hypothetical protein
MQKQLSLKNENISHLQALFTSKNHLLTNQAAFPNILQKIFGE